MFLVETVTEMLLLVRTVMMATTPMEMAVPLLVKLKPIGNAQMSSTQQLIPDLANVLNNLIVEME